MVHGSGIQITLDDAPVFVCGKYKHCSGGTITIYPDGKDVKAAWDNYPGSLTMGTIQILRDFCLSKTRPEMGGVK